MMRVKMRRVKMKNYMKAKTMIAVVCMMFFVLSCGTALAEGQHITKVYLHYDKSIWERDFNGRKVTIITLGIFDKDGNQAGGSVRLQKTPKNSEFILQTNEISTNAVGSKNEKLKAHISINDTSSHFLKIFDVWFKNDEKNKNIVLEDLLDGK
jgi:hypothetical protein